jgi:hypothetical protein
MNDNLYTDRSIGPTPPITAEPSLAELEAVIERGRQTFVEVGTALWKIRGRRLYREREHATFEEYCQKRWGWTSRHAERQMIAAAVVENVRPIGRIPQTESQARELLRLTPEHQLIVAGRIDFTTATAEQIRAEVVNNLGTIVPKPKRETHARAGVVRLLDYATVGNCPNFQRCWSAECSGKV